MNRTFAELGIPFPLFEAPIEEASGYFGQANCSLCGSTGHHCFQLGIGDQIVIGCAQCGTENGLDATDVVDGVCINCAYTVRFPVLPRHSTGDFAVCYQCLRTGKAALGKNTVLGMVLWEQANAGITHGAPGLNHPEFEMIPIPDDPGAGSFPGQDGWVTARVDKNLLFELVRTPSYPTWQGEEWQFCCRRPMIYIGTWNQLEFEQHASEGAGRDLFLSVVEETHDELWQKGEMASAIVTYMFRCSVCGGYKGHWDVD